MDDGLSLIIPFGDDTADWRTCFGLTDNPFRPLHPQNNLPLDTLKIDARPLAPHLHATLYPKFFAIKADHFEQSVKEFQQYMLRQTMRDAVIIVVHGSIGCGKTTFSNLCRHILALSKPPFAFYDVDFGDLPHRRPSISPLGLVDERILANLRREEKTVGTHALVLIENLTAQVLNLDSFEPNQPFQFLDYIARKIEEFVVPFVFATTSESTLLKDFVNRPLGSAGYMTWFELGDIDRKQVLDYIKERLKCFRDQEEHLYPDAYFPFQPDAIETCFTELDRSGLAVEGRLPFRTVNQLLANAIRAKQIELISNQPNPLQPGMSQQEVAVRLVTASHLNSAIERRFYGNV